MTVFDMKTMCSEPKGEHITIFKFNEMAGAYQQVFAGMVSDIPATLNRATLDSWDTNENGLCVNVVTFNE